jgi:hypothetical protein
MNSFSNLLNRVRSSYRAEFLSPKDFLQRAVAITVLFLASEIAGLREFTSVLSGTAGSTELGWKTSAILGAAYIVLYLAFVLVVPILILASVILWLWKRKLLRKA